MGTYFGLGSQVVDLFAGAGGLTLGFVRAGFNPVFAVESDSAAARTYKRNFGAHVFDGRIEEVLEFPDAAVIIGGPPCQGFSPLGKNRDSESRGRMNELWRHYVRAVKQVRPAVFVIENVPQFLTSDQFEAFLVEMSSDRLLADYELDYRVLHAVNYGVPQRRRRGIVLASRVGPVTWPPITHGPEADPPRPYTTVREAIGDLSFEPDGNDLHIGRNPTPKSLERYRAVPEGGNRFDLAENRPDLLPRCWAEKKTGTTDVFGRLWWDRPSVTIRTEFFKPEKGRYLHPEAHRPITHREAARLQTFPDDFRFEGSPLEIARQIGNAVPPVMGYAIASAVKIMLGGSGHREP